MPKSGDNRKGVTPVPIPNTEVKPFSAEDTWWEAAWENRTLPVNKKTLFYKGVFFEFEAYKPVEHAKRAKQ